MSSDGRETASIAVKSPHVSLCRLGKPAAKVGRHRMQNPRSPGDMRARITCKAQLLVQTDGRPRGGAKKSEMKEERSNFWPTRVQENEQGLRGFIPLLRLVWLHTPKPRCIPHSNTTKGYQLPSTIRSNFFRFFKRLEGGREEKVGMKGEINWPMRVFANCL